MRCKVSEYKFKVYNNRRNSEITYTIKPTKTGWHISHISINGDCEPNGNPYFYKNFDQDYISYPNSFGDKLEWLWEQVNKNILSENEIQRKLQELADWVSICEKNVPMWKGFNA